MGWPLEAALAALRLIVRGVFDRHPALQLVLGHWGELLLFWQWFGTAFPTDEDRERFMAGNARALFAITS